MAKKLMVLVGLLAVLLAAAVPAFAQQGSLTIPVGATGDTRTVNFELTVEGTPPADTTFFAQTVQGLGVQLTDTDGDGTYTGSITFATQNFPEGAPLQIVQGTGTAPSTGDTLRPGQPSSLIEDFGTVPFEDGDTLSASVSFPDGGSNPPGPPPGEEFATLTFELAVEGTPPADATFFGNLQTGEGGPGSFTPLTDPDGDGLYTGSTTAPRFGPGPRPVPPGVEPLSFGVRIVQGTGTQGSLPGQPITVIKDFGAAPMNDRTFSASVSFDDGGTTPDRSATLSFELTVTGEPPADARFFGAVPAEGCISTPLTDPDGDGVYTGSVDVPRFPPGPAPPDAEPVSLPVQIVQAGSGAGPCNQATVIEDFGVVPVEGDKTFRSAVNFNEGGGGATTPDDRTTPDPDDGNGGSGGGSGGSGSGGGSETGSESSSGSGGITGLLPSTGGGVAFTVLVVGVLLVAGGLLVRRLSR